MATVLPISARPIYATVGTSRLAVMHDIWEIEDDLRELDEAACAADAGQ